MPLVWFVVHSHLHSLGNVLIKMEKRKGIHASFSSCVFVLEAADGLGSVGVFRCMCLTVVPGC